MIILTQKDSIQTVFNISNLSQNDDELIKKIIVLIDDEQDKLQKEFENL